MRVPREDRPPFEPRTLRSLEADLLQFETAGKGNIKKAKEYNNVISTQFFPIPLDQVKHAEDKVSHPFDVHVYMYMYIRCVPRVSTYHWASFIRYGAWLRRDAMN